MPDAKDVEKRRGEEIKKEKKNKKKENKFE